MQVPLHQDLRRRDERVRRDEVVVVQVPLDAREEGALRAAGEAEHVDEQMEALERSITPTLEERAASPDAIGLDPAETVTCTFTNTKRGAIVIQKVTDPAGDPQSFSITRCGGGLIGLPMPRSMMSAPCCRIWCLSVLIRPKPRPSNSGALLSSLRESTCSRLKRPMWRSFRSSSSSRRGTP